MADASGSGSASEQAYSHDRRIIIYPAYINSKIATSAGRKMPMAHCCDSPTVFEIVEVLKHLGYENPVIEDNTHPRSDWSQRGRVRVPLKDPQTGDLTVEDIATRKQIMVRLSEMIPNLKSRKEPKPKPPVDPRMVGMPGMPPGYPGLPGQPAQAIKAPEASSGSSKKKGKKAK